MQKKYWLGFVGVASILLLAGAGCSQNANNKNEVETKSTSTETSSNQGQNNDNQTTTKLEDNQKKQEKAKNNDDKEVISADGADAESPTEDNLSEIEKGVKEISTKPTPSTAVKEFTITAKTWEFTPGTITVNQGDKVRLKITSLDVTHSFMLKDYGLNVKLEPNQTQIIEFTADKAGTFGFRCGVPCGEGHSSMDGTLIVK
jgi:cytochrome c oxidase subunit 2